MATINEENANIICTHYHTVFNRRANIDYSVLEEVFLICYRAYFAYHLWERFLVVINSEKIVSD